MYFVLRRTQAQLNAARCVIVVWSKESVRSRWVKTEAAVAVERDCLVPLSIDDAPIPLEFRRIQIAMMQGWNGAAIQGCGVRRSSREVFWAAAAAGSGRAAGHGAAAKAGL
jgi:hypothetical protein